MAPDLPGRGEAVVAIYMYMQDRDTIHKPQNIVMISSLLLPAVVVAEWLRRWTRNPLGSPRAGSNPADYEFFFPAYIFFFLLISVSTIFFSLCCTKYCFSLGKRAFYFFPLPISAFTTFSLLAVPSIVPG